MIPRQPDYRSEIAGSLPPGAEIAMLPGTDNRPAYLSADVDGDGRTEIVAVYKEKGEMYVTVLKLHDGVWRRMAVVKGRGYNVTDLIAAPIAGGKGQTIAIGWQIGSIWSELDLLQWTPKGFQHLLPKEMYYSRLEVEDMPGPEGKDDNAELALWVHDTGNAYKIEVYRWTEGGLVPAPDLYPYYFKKVIPYYESLLKEYPDFTIYWYDLADAQAKAGMREAAIQSIDRALSYPNPYPGREKLLQMKKELQDRYSRSSTDSAGGPRAVLDQQHGDVDGDGTMDRVFLTGEQAAGATVPFASHLVLNVQNGRTNAIARLPLKEGGVNPTIFLGDFTGDKTADMLVVVNSGGSGGMIRAYLFTYQDGAIRQIFDSEAFNKGRDNYKVVYKDGYKVEVDNRQLNNVYSIDISNRGAAYLSSLYHRNGKLRKPLTGEVADLSGLYPVDYERDGTYELNAAQSIIGRSDAERFGFVETVLRWDGSHFAPARQFVEIYGDELVNGQAPVYQNAAFRNVKVSKRSPGHFTVTGEARVFEGTIQYEVLENARVIAKSFTTASAGGPEWGAFQIRLSFHQKPNVSYLIVMYEENQADEGEKRLHTLMLPLK
ncbi:Gmad2 immunoglobulin-like domain-containing protein [Paenibacillus sp. MBLB4367]|uniref:Gmad2 immunoglobulin-like domain-containing protein n=1 Tax=Paenibacillus sp. MBLB4367 TaxID=3384767 RepID=UPI00390825E0